MFPRLPHFDSKVGAWFVIIYIYICLFSVLIEVEDTFFLSPMSSQ